MHPKFIILNYVDSLIREIDIFTEEQLLKCSEDDCVVHLQNDSNSIPKVVKPDDVKSSFSDDLLIDLESIDDIWEHGKSKIFNEHKPPKYDFMLPDKQIDFEPITIKKSEYLNRVREEMLAEIAKVQEETFMRYESIKNEIKQKEEELSNNEYMTETLFAKKFAFAFKHDSNSKLRLIVTDFYLNKNHIELLRKWFDGVIIGEDQDLNDLEGEETKLDREYLLTYLLEKYLRSFINHYKFENSVIRISKHDLLSSDLKCIMESLVREDDDHKYLGEIELDLASDPDFAKLTHFEIKVNFSSDNLEYLSACKFQIPASLVSFRLSNTVKTYYSSMFFKTLTQLRCLFLSRCSFLSISTDVFASLVNLKVLQLENVSHNLRINLDVLPNLEWLKWVSCHENRNEIPSLKNLKRLKVFEYENWYDSKELECSNMISEWKCENLIAFHLSLRNKEFDSCCLNGMPNLRFIKIEKPSLKMAKISNLTNLKSLDLSENANLELIPCAFDGLTNLESLFLNKSYLKSLDNQLFRNLNNLTVLDLSENTLNQLEPELFASNLKLTHLNLKSTSLTDITKEHFAQLGHLKSLDLSTNELKDLPDEVFSSLVSLESLKLNSNKIKEINANVFKGIQSLREINLFDNLLDYLPADVFSTLNSLEKVDLDFNFITESNLKELRENYPRVEITNSNLKWRKNI